MGNSIVGKLQQSDYDKRLAQQNAISDALNNVKIQGADDLSAYLPEHDLSNLIADGYSYDGGSNSVTDISELAAKSGFFAEDLKLKQLSLDASTARINSFETDMYHMDGEVKSVFRGFEQKGIVNDDLLRAEIGNYFDKNLDLGFGLSNESMSDYMFESIDSYRGSKSLLSDVSNFTNGMAVNSGVLALGLKNGWGTSANAGKAIDIFWNNPQLTNHMDWKFAQPLMGSLDKGFSFLSPLVSGFNAANETIYNPDGFDYGDAFREWGKVGVDTAAALTEIGSLARFNPVGLVYTGVDLAVQNLPAHTVKFGSQAGQQKTGWTGLWYSSVDYEAQKVVNGTTWIGPKY